MENEKNVINNRKYLYTENEKNDMIVNIKFFGRTVYL